MVKRKKRKKNKVKNENTMSVVDMVDMKSLENNGNRIKSYAALTELLVEGKEKPEKMKNNTLITRFFNGIDGVFPLSIDLETEYIYIKTVNGWELMNNYYPSLNVHLLAKAGLPLITLTPQAERLVKDCLNPLKNVKNIIKLGDFYFNKETFIKDINKFKDLKVKDLEIDDICGCLLKNEVIEKIDYYSKPTRTLMKGFTNVKSKLEDLYCDDNHKKFFLPKLINIIHDKYLDDFLMWCGYLFLDEYINRTPYIEGNTNIGKSTLINLLCLILTETEVESFSFKELSSPHGTAALVGKQLIKYPDETVGDLFEKDKQVKTVLGREEMRVNPKYGNTFTVYKHKVPFSIVDSNDPLYFGKGKPQNYRRFINVVCDQAILLAENETTLAYEKYVYQDEIAIIFLVLSAFKAFFNVNPTVDPYEYEEECLKNYSKDWDFLEKYFVVAEDDGSYVKSTAIRTAVMEMYKKVNGKLCSKSKIKSMINYYFDVDEVVIRYEDGVTKVFGNLKMKDDGFILLSEECQEKYTNSEIFK